MFSKNKTRKNYAKKQAKDFNLLTKLYQIYALYVLFLPFSFLFYNIRYKKSDYDVKKPCIIAPNHISYFDPFLATMVSGIGLAYMAKKELFEGESFLAKYVKKNVSRLGAFAVNREKLEVATIKSTKEVFKANFSLCIFPQGGIRKNRRIESVNKGFAVVAKMVKADIVPVAISGVEKYNWNIFKRANITLQAGKPISYLDDEEDIIKNWREQIADMTNYELL